jgi:hypothetical protein
MTRPGGLVERRHFGRRNTAIHGWIIVPGRPRVPCLVRNVSEGGALLECTPPGWLPYYFTLQIDCKGFTAFCEVRHTKETWIGVRFDRVTAQVEPIASWSPLVEDSWAGERKPQLVK